MIAMSLAGGKISLEFPPGEEETAGVIAGACDEALRLARTLWGLEPPTACHLLVMTSWKGFIFRSAPWPWKLMLGATFPVWSPWARQAWPYSAGWTQRFGRKVAIGIKPPRLLETSDKSIGAHMYIEEKDPSAKIRHLTCHELMHAASAHLVLPAWLNEGLAAVTVDRFMGKPTIREDTLALVQRHLPKGPPRTYRQLSRLPGEAVAYHAVRGYWIVRLLEETHPGFVRGLLATRQLHRAAERQVAERLGLRPASLWRDVDDLVVTHFRSRGLTAD